MNGYDQMLYLINTQDLPVALPEGEPVHASFEISTKWIVRCAIGNFLARLVRVNLALENKSLSVCGMEK